jgi:hypothetical protein
MVLKRSDVTTTVQGIVHNLALLANLIFLARRTNATQQQRYLDWAYEVIEEVHRLRLRDDVGGKCRSDDATSLASNRSNSPTTHTREARLRKPELTSCLFP